MKCNSWILIVLSLLVIGGAFYGLNYLPTRPTGSPQSEKKSPFSVKIEATETVSLNEELIATATLVNTTDSNYTFKYGSSIFRFYVYDENGKKINTLIRSALMIETTIKGHESREEQFRYRFSKPGVYYLEAVADITATDEEFYQLPSAREKVTVQ